MFIILEFLVCLRLVVTCLAAAICKSSDYSVISLVIVSFLWHLYCIPRLTSTAYSLILSSLFCSLVSCCNVSTTGNKQQADDQNILCFCPPVGCSLCTVIAFYTRVHRAVCASANWHTASAPTSLASAAVYISRILCVGAESFRFNFEGSSGLEAPNHGFGSSAAR